MDLSKEGENYTTMRSLLAMLRLAQARAKLRFSNEVSKADIDDSLILIEESQRSVSNPKFDGRRDKATDDLSSIYQICKDICLYSKDKSADYESILKRALARGYTQDALGTTISHYEKLNLLMASSDKNRITLVED